MRAQLESLLKNPGCDYLEIRLEDIEETRFLFLGKELNTLKQDYSGGAAIRAFEKGCWGFVTINNLDDLEKSVEAARKAARAAANVSPSEAKLAKVEPVDLRFDLEVLQDPRHVPLQNKLELFQKYNERILAGQGITSSWVRYFDTYTHKVFANSEGSYFEREYVDLGCHLSAVASRSGQTRRASVAQGSSNNYGIVQGLEEELDAAIEAAHLMLDAPVVNAGSYPVVCDPEMAGVFVHEAFGHLSEGDFIAKDKQMQEVLTLGRQFGEDFLNIYDTGLDKGLRGYIPIDDEGVTTERTDLIRGGKLVGRLHDRESAGQLGEKPTGNARAISYRYPPIPRMRNTCIAPGPHGDFEELIHDIPLGVYAKSYVGGQTNGELFTFTAADAFMIRDGKLAERVKDVTISGNLFETLKNIDRISSDYRVRDTSGGCGKAGQSPLPVSEGSPHIRIQNCVIGGQ